MVLIYICIGAEYCTRLYVFGVDVYSICNEVRTAVYVLLFFVVVAVFGIRTWRTSLYYWIDLEQTEGDVSGTWTWGDGTALSYNAWNPGDPNIYYQANIGQKLVIFRDEPATLKAHFICEK